ncbi:PadR family transcriptional regulator [Nonomuraea sp. B12E4]|uniref:PadR family transcriptional regulator n=1 Tax=Nonomuraea sp. B12E4 TaxID=3153564 RepID=UPI00325DE344
MTLRHALLGLLAGKPASGFELTKVFEESLGQWAWHTTHSHIYPELRRLHEAGLVEIVERASRGRKTYAITPEGRQELRRWMMEPPVSETVRNEGALRMFLINTLEPAEARALLRQYADNASRRLEALHAQLANADQAWRDNPLAVGRLAAERGLRTLPALRDWALWGIDQLDRMQERFTQSGDAEQD